MVIRDNYFHVFGRDIPYYGLLFVLGFAVAALTALPKMKKLKLSGVDTVCSAVFAGIGGVLGAKLLSVLTSIGYIIEYHISFIDVIRNGFVFYGGLIGGVIGLVIYAKAFRLPLLPLFDLYAAGTALGHAVGRVGCLISGCCYGLPAEGSFYVLYTHAVDPNTPLGTPLLPIQLIECFCLVGIFALCECLFYFTKRRGVSAFAYAGTYAVTRFVLEFFRGDAVRGVFGGLSTSQYISLAILAILSAILAARFLSFYAHSRG